jgi:intracellular sulfur oxidation DsrE/DsrF family protein
MSETLHRRSFIGRVAATGAVLGATSALSTLTASTAMAAARSPESDLETWLKAAKGPHKVIYDCTTPQGASDGILYARNFLTTSAAKLGTPDSEMGVIVSFRHFSTPFAYGDAIWAKYPQLAETLRIVDPKSGKTAAGNFRLRDDVMGFSDATIPGLLAHGVRFAACGEATTFIAGLLAGTGTPGRAKAIEEELLANLIPGARVVPAGVVVLQRAQKAGFAYTYAG